MTELVLLTGAGVRMNWSRWVVDCAWCTSGLIPGVHLFDAGGRKVRHSLEWGDRSMVCWDCGGVTEGIEWPPDPLAIELILSMRPEEKTRNWFPGETLNDLLQENVAHGIVPPDVLLPHGGGVLMSTVDEMVVGGTVGALIRQIDPSRVMTEIED